MAWIGFKDGQYPRTSGTTPPTVKHKKIVHFVERVSKKSKRKSQNYHRLLLSEHSVFINHTEKYSNIDKLQFIEIFGRQFCNSENSDNGQ